VLHGLRRCDNCWKSKCMHVYNTSLNKSLVLGGIKWATKLSKIYSQTRNFYFLHLFTSTKDCLSFRSANKVTDVRDYWSLSNSFQLTLTWSRSFLEIIHTDKQQDACFPINWECSALVLLFLICWNTETCCLWLTICINRTIPYVKQSRCNRLKLVNGIKSRA